MTSDTADPVAQIPTPQAGRLRILAAIALACVAFAFVLQRQPAAIWALTLGASLFALVTVLAARQICCRMALRAATSRLRAHFENDAIASVITDMRGAIAWHNPAARLRFRASDHLTMPDLLRGTIGDATAVSKRVQGLACRSGFVREDLVTTSGTLMLSAQRLDEGQLLWRLEHRAALSPLPADFDGLPFPVMTTNAQGAIVSMNEEARQLTGDQPAVLNHVFPDLPIRPGQSNQVITSDGARGFHILERCLDPDHRDLIFLPLSDGPGEGPGIDALPVAMLRLDPRGCILGANAPALALLGDEPVKGRRIGDVMEGLGRPVSGWIEDAVRRRQTAKSEFLRLTRKDKEVFVQVTLSATQHGGEDCLIAFLSDATELKTLEAQFVQSQKMQAIGQLAGGVAHDFNNLLTAISGHCDLMLLRHDPGDEDYADLMQINQNANRAASLVGQLLAFSRKQTLCPEILDVRDTLSDLTHLLNRLVGEKVQLTLSHDPVLGAIRADKRQLEQVLMNLVVNARDAMPQGGEIKIITQALTLKDPMERDRVCVPPGDYVSVKVVDQGTGIAGDKLQKVFEPFFTTKRTGEGTGLGLSTAYGIVKQTGGYIFVDSTLGEGTCFWLIFPVRHVGRRIQTAPPVEAKTSLPKHGEGVVLLVEDEAPVRAFASRALRLRGYTVIEAASAEDALEALEDNSLNVDVFVTDVVMPGLDGPTWVRQALKTRPDVRVVFMSGYAEGAFGDTQPNVANSVFLQKPFSLNQLTDLVHDQITVTVPAAS